ncbi:hypothetical protein BX666DRAFT_1272061 [Dichotomocladium elegans]|nr:hypothetical protein BX666DRAFT_1272061 [Dichotomocladium elegans]
MLSRVTLLRSPVIAPLRRSCLGFIHTPNTRRPSDSGRSSLLSKIEHKKTAKHPSQEMRDFSKLLDSLWSQSPVNARNSREQQQARQEDKKTRRIQSSIEKQLLNLILQKNQTYKSKSPLPRGVLSTFYRGEQKGDRRGKVAEEPVHVTAARKARDEANREIEAMIACESSHKLLKHVLHLQEQYHVQGEERLPPYYAQLFTRAIEHADKVLNDPYMAISIFEQVKNRSLASYVMGCTVDMYNAMLTTRWRAFRDIHGMMNLVDEMNANGVGFDHTTREIIQEVVTEVGGEMSLDVKERDGLAWSSEEQRSANVMKALVSKWLLK